jgi:hypothetical protein
MVLGRWQRPTLSEVTRLVTEDGSPIALAPGRTWVELLPSDIAIDVKR